MSDEIPTLVHPDDAPPIRTQEDLHRHWRMLMGPLGFARRTLWLQLLEGDRPTPMIVPIDDLPRRPSARDVTALMDMLTELAKGIPESSFAFLLSRPGGAGMTEDEGLWAQALMDGLQHAGLQVWPVHRANDDELVVCSPDDLAASA